MFRQAQHQATSEIDSAKIIADAKYMPIQLSEVEGMAIGVSFSVLSIILIMK